MFYYADIDANGVCQSISGYEDSEKQSLFQIPLEGYDISVIGMRWNGKAWEDYEPEPTPQQPTEAQIAQAKLDYILMMQETL